MKINQCGINMKVRAKKDISRRIKKGDLVKIRFVDQEEETINIDNGKVIVAEINPIHFEPISIFIKPISKFKIGDKVIWNNIKVEIWGKHFEEDKREYEYAFKDKKNAWNRGIAYESDLSPLKKISELEKGDVCKQYAGDKLEIISRANNEYLNEITYFVKSLEGDFKGCTDVILAETIDEIIYE